MPVRTLAMHFEPLLFEKKVEYSRIVGDGASDLGNEWAVRLEM